MTGKADCLPFSKKKAETDRFFFPLCTSISVLVSSFLRLCDCPWKIEKEKKGEEGKRRNVRRWRQQSSLSLSLSLSLWKQQWRKRGGGVGMLGTLGARGGGVGERRRETGCGTSHVETKGREEEGETEEEKMAEDDAALS